jgi:hypothetical protein
MGVFRLFIYLVVNYLVQYGYPRGQTKLRKRLWILWKGVRALRPGMRVVLGYLYLKGLFTPPWYVLVDLCKSGRLRHTSFKVLSKPPPTLRDTLRGRAPLDNVASLLHPPPAPLSGTNNLLPPTGVNIPVPSVNLRFREAVNALSERLASDKWFLGSRYVSLVVT